MNNKTIREVLIAGVMIYIASSLIYRELFFSGSLLAPILAFGVMLVLIIWRPVVGVVLYFLLYPMVPSSANIDYLKIGMLALTIILLFVWWWICVRKNERPWFHREYRWIFIFFIYLCLSPLLGIKYGFSVIDWARDISPMFNLLLIPVFVHFLDMKEYRWLPFLVFIPWLLGTVISVVALLSMYNILGFNQLPSFLTVFRYFHPSYLVGFGLLMYIGRIPRRGLWLSLMILGLVFTVLTPGRTIWITVVIMIALVVLFATKYRVQAIVALAILLMIMGWYLYNSSDTVYGEMQSSRFQQLENYQEDMSFKNRMDEVGQGFDLFLSSPVYGVGFGYQYVFWRHFVSGIGPGYLNTNFMHTDIIYVLSKGGLFGPIFFAAMLLALWHQFRRIQHSKQDQVIQTLAIFAAMVVFVSIIIGLSTPILQSRTNCFMFSFIVALGLSKWGSYVLNENRDSEAGTGTPVLIDKNLQPPIGPWA